MSLRDFAGTDSFRLTYNGAQSAAITNGVNYTAAGIVAAIKGDLRLPGGGDGDRVRVGQRDRRAERRPASRSSSAARSPASTSRRSR